jgi:hypothetical protein
MTVLYRFTVAGDRQGMFPIDELRAQRCWPKTTRDSVLIHRLSVPSSYAPRDNLSMEVHIELESNQPPLHYRWRDFDYMVIDSSSEDVSRAVPRA